MNNPSTITPQAVAKQRDSNMEVLRILAMVLVMVVHANFRALPIPGADRVAHFPVSSLLQFFTEGASVIAVNVFVLLSGWYGIRPKLNRFLELVFQVFFFTLIGAGICAFVAPEQFKPLSRFLTRFFMLEDGNYWFLKTYMALYIISPVLNAFVDHATQRQFAGILLAFFGFQFVFGWAWEATTWFKAGYSLPSFMGLYLLARYMHLYPIKLWQRSKWFDACIYAIATLLFTLLMFVMKSKGMRGGALYFYNCPLVIFSAMHFLLFFTKLSFKSKFVNWVAISAFAIYLTHSGTFLWKFYDNAILYWFQHESTGTFIAYVFVMMVGVFWASILLDKLRLFLWKKLYNRFNNKT